MVREAAKNGAEIIMLPEIFSTSYTQEYMLKEKEVIDLKQPQKSGPSYQCLKSISKETGTYIIGGSIPEAIKGNEKIHNTTLCFDP